MAAENFKVKKGLEVGTGTTITSSGINVSGIITATQLVGDGSGLTNVVGSGSGIVVKDEGSAVGTAGTINFAGTGVVAALSAGIATVTISSGGLDNVVGDTTPELGGNLNLNSKFITGSGGINVTGVVTATTLKGNGDFVDIDVDGQTELDELNVAGITTFNANVDVKAELTANKLILDDDGSSSPTLTIAGDDENVFGMVLVNDTYKSSAAAGFKHTQLNSGEIQVLLRANNSATRLPYKIQQGNAPSGLWDSFTIDADGAVKLGFGGTQKLETTGTGIAVPNISVSGVGTFSTRIDTNGVSFGTNSTTFAAKFLDDAVINVGTGNDLQISHVNDVSLIRDTRAGAGATLAIGADKLFLRNKDGNENYLEATDNGSVKLFYDFAPKFETDTGGVKITGVATATSFSGSAAGLTNIPSAQLSGALPALDGSALTGVTASGSGVVVKHDGSTVGTAGTINFSTNLDVSAISAGIVTVTASGGSATNTISQGNSSVEVIGSGQDDGEFKIVLQDNTYTGTGRTAFRMYQPSASSNFAEFFEENTAIGSLLGLNAIYGGNTAQTIRFATSNSNFMQRIVSETASGQMYFRTKYNGTDYTPLQIGTTIIYTKASVHPLTDNTYDLGYQGSGGGALTLWWRQLRVHNINVGIVTATTRFVGSGVSLTSLNASELDSGIIPNGRFPTTLPAVSGANLTALNADNISSGTLASARIEDNAVTFDKLEDVANSRILGRVSSGAGNAEELTAAQVRTLINVEDGATAAGGSGISTVSGVVNIANNLDVDGHTELDNVNIVGVTTIRNASNTKLYEGVANGSKLFHAGGEKLSTELHGISINGTVVAKFVDLTSGGNPGIITARSFSGGGDGKFVTARWTVGNNGSSDYSFTGPGGLSSTNDPKLYLARGQTYEFVITYGGSHPFQIQQSNGSAYNTGVTNNGVNSNDVVVKFEVPFSAPNTLQYKCTSHSSMGNTIIIYPDLSP